MNSEKFLSIWVIIHSVLYLSILNTIFLFSGCKISEIVDQPQYCENTRLTAGEVKPMRWIREQNLSDLRDGITGNLEKISDNVNGNLYVNADRVPGTYVLGIRGLSEKAWWAGEHEGYWKNAVIRFAFLVGDNAQTQKQ